MSEVSAVGIEIGIVNDGNATIRNGIFISVNFLPERKATTFK